MGFSRQDYRTDFHSLLQWTTFCQTSPTGPVCLGWVSLSETRLWFMWSDWQFSVIMVSVGWPSNALSQHLPSYLGFSYLGWRVRDWMDWIGKDEEISWLLQQEWSRAKANRVLPRERTGHSEHPLPATQEKTLHVDVTRWPTPKSDWLYSLQPKMEKLYTVSKNKTRSWLWLRSLNPYGKINT